MRKAEQLLQRAREFDDSARALVDDLVQVYEGEMESMTAHMVEMYEELMLVHNLGDEIAGTLDVDQIADRAAVRVAELLNARESVVMLLTDGAEGRLESVGSTPPASAATALLTWATRQTMLRERCLIHNEPGTGDVPAAPGIANLLSCPLRSGGQLTGVMHVLDKAGGFSTQDQTLLQAIGTQLGAALQSSRLFHVEQEHAHQLAAALDELSSTYDHTLAALSGALDLRDNETEGHARRVTRFTVRIAQQLGVSGRDLIDVERGALLHDIGKIGVPDSILLKPAKLTDEEWDVMKQHPVLGHQMIRNIRFLAGGAPIVLHHHERFDGKGYPAGLTGDAIPLGARIFAVADTFDAMTSDRPYRKALAHEVACEEIQRCAETQFDPAVTAAFAAVSEEEWVAIRAEVEQQLTDRRKEQLIVRMRTA